MNYAGQRALITGAGRGVGREIALRLAEAGVHVLLCARSVDQLESVAGECRALGVEADFTALDCSDPNAVEEFADKHLGDDSPIDILVNCAGAVITGEPTAGKPSSWQKLMQLNLLTPMTLTRYCSSAMIARERGTIINIGSVAAIDAMRGAAAYSASKHGLRGWTRSCYEQLRNHGIKVMLINPGYIDTKLVFDRPNLDRSKMIQASDVAEAAMLAVRTSPMCCPTEIDLRLTKTCIVG